MCVPHLFPDLPLPSLLCSPFPCPATLPQPPSQVGFSLPHSLMPSPPFPMPVDVSTLPAWKHLTCHPTTLPLAPLLLLPHDCTSEFYPTLCQLCLYPASLSSCLHSTHFMLGVVVPTVYCNLNVASLLPLLFYPFYTWIPLPTPLQDTDPLKQCATLPLAPSRAGPCIITLPPLPVPVGHCTYLPSYCETNPSFIRRDYLCCRRFFLHTPPPGCGRGTDITHHHACLLLQCLPLPPTTTPHTRAFTCSLCSPFPCFLHPHPLLPMYILCLSDHFFFPTMPAVPACLPWRRRDRHSI